MELYLHTKTNVRLNKDQFTIILTQFRGQFYYGKHFWTKREKYISVEGNLSLPDMLQV